MAIHYDLVRHSYAADILRPCRCYSFEVPRSAEWLIIAVGFLIAAAACVLLLDSWSSWRAGPWADCPNYAFGCSWYPEPPLIATFVPCAASLASTALFIFLLVRKRQRLIASIGLVIAVAPLVAVIVLPIISNVLGMTTAGC